MKDMIFLISLLLFVTNCQKRVIEEQEELRMPLIETITFDSIAFTVCTVNPKDFDLKFASYSEDGIQKIKALGDSLFAIKKQLLFATNGGIFNKGYFPGGLFINNGKLLNKLNEKKGFGNFHLMPNGVFCLKKDGSAFVAESQAFKRKRQEDIDIGIQSGPMLVIDDEIHPAFRKGSENVHIRNGVGVNAEGNMVFVISNSRTNFYSFAVLFRDHLECDQALYLDGAISEMYIHGISEPNEIQRKFATIFYLEGDLVQ